MCKKITYLSACLVCSLTACGGGGGGGGSSESGSGPDGIDGSGGGGTGSSGTVSFYGFMQVSDDVDDNEVTINGGFARFSGAVLFPDFESAIGQLNNAPDTCEVTVSDSIIIDEDDDDDIDIEIPNISVSLVSAGEIIPFTSATAGSFAELERMVQFGQTFYTLAGDPSSGIPGPVPADLTFSIPGDVFPAYPSVAVPNMTSLGNISPDLNSAVTGDTIFTWDAGAGSDAVVSISATGFTQTIVNDLPTVSFAILDCEVIDDGIFALPATTQTEIANSGIDFFFGSMSKTLTSLEQNGNSVLIVTRSSDT